MKKPVYTEARLQSSGFRQFVDCTRADGSAAYHMWLNADGTPESIEVHKNAEIPGASLARRHRSLSRLRGEGKIVAAHMLAAVTPEALAVLAQGREADERAAAAERHASAIRHRAAMAAPELMKALRDLMDAIPHVDLCMVSAEHDAAEALLKRINTGAA